MKFVDWFFRFLMVIFFICSISEFFDSKYGPGIAMFMLAWSCNHLARSVRAVG